MYKLHGIAAPRASVVGAERVVLITRNVRGVLGLTWAATETSTMEEGEALQTLAQLRHDHDRLLQHQVLLLSGDWALCI